MQRCKFGGKPVSPARTASLLRAKAKEKIVDRIIVGLDRVLRLFGLDVGMGNSDMPLHQVINRFPGNPPKNPESVIKILGVLDANLLRLVVIEYKCWANWYKGLYLHFNQKGTDGLQYMAIVWRS